MCTSAPGAGKELIMPRSTGPDKDLSLLLTRMDLALPQQPPPSLRKLTNRPQRIARESPVG
ncbi:MAG: hypothetical protein KDN22_25425 [Verrucomicrobiae bacterium]|nr:hypothetical protein [Verrucomicrobiae bacterium]